MCMDGLVQLLMMLAKPRTKLIHVSSSKTSLGSSYLFSVYMSYFIIAVPTACETVSENTRS